MSDTDDLKARPLGDISDALPDDNDMQDTFPHRRVLMVAGRPHFGQSAVACKKLSKRFRITEISKSSSSTRACGGIAGYLGWQQTESESGSTGPAIVQRVMTLSQKRSRQFCRFAARPTTQEQRSCPDACDSAGRNFRRRTFAYVPEGVH